MTETTAPALTRTPGGPQRATLLELFFDLVFVAALALTSIDLARKLSWAGVVEGLLPLLAVWWVWQITTLVTDYYDPERWPIQAILGGTMLGSILLAATLPAAFGPHGLFFAIVYVTIHLGRGLPLVTFQRGGPQIRAARFMIWFGVSTPAWILGALSPHPTTRGALWALALALEYLIGALRYPVPRLGRVPLSQYETAGRHLGERYQQFMILTLGDLIVVPALKFGQTGFSGLRTAALLAAFAATALLWQIYVFRIGLRFETVIDQNPGRVERWAPYTQVLTVAGVVALGTGFELVIGQPGGTTPAAWAVVLFAGPALFLVGRITFEYQMFRRYSRSRVAWAVVLIPMAVVACAVPPLLATVLVAINLLGVAVTDAIRGRRGSGRLSGDP
ncbi:low temperature requirement protein A [Rugosimonospora acidiphila]|uniref:Low temperature requirement protein A n=1 Tax=Rugosimonospora acidiphila TaxID=556531 RepID=A0ABP9SLJ6_9ACTN